MTADELVAKGGSLPQISAAALKLVELLEADDDSGEAVRLIKSDSVMLAKLLRVCNSSALGLSEPVASVEHALLLLGYRQVLGLVLSLGFGSSMRIALPGYALTANALLRHALATATAAENLAERGLLPEADASVAYTAGLLHDIGKLVMAQALPREAQTVIRTHMSAEGLSSVAAEREVLGTDHAEVGAYLLHIWRLPAWIVEATANHHKPTFEPTQLSAIIYLANRIAHVSQGKSEGYAFRDGEPVLRAFELSIKDVEDLVQGLGKSAERANELMAIV
jgi:putative nucleotidyltransferase with HDIG domain